VTHHAEPRHRTRVSTSLQESNYALVQADSVFVGILDAAAIFLPVFLVRLGASGEQVGLLTALPALTAFVLAIPMGRWLQRRRNIVPWYSRLRLVGWLSYAAMALATVLAPADLAVPAMLAVWAAASLPLTAGQIAFPIVMDGVSGPQGRYDLLGRRWAIMGVVTALTVVAAGQALGLLAFPSNFEWLMVGFSLSGLVSFAISRRIVIPDQVPLPGAPTVSLSVRLRTFVSLVAAESPFLSYELRAFVYTAGVGLTMPLLPLFYVQELHAPDAWIGIIGAGQSAGAVGGYLLARRTSQRLGGAAVLLPSLLLAALVPAGMAVLNTLPPVAAFAVVGGAATAGAYLALFDELMQRVPRRHGVTFSAVDQSAKNFALIVSPVAGGLLAVTLGVRAGLEVAALVALCGFALFALHWRADQRRTAAVVR
jgi:MFS family permease